MWTPFFALACSIQRTETMEVDFWLKWQHFASYCLVHETWLCTVFCAIFCNKASDPKLFIGIWPTVSSCRSTSYRRKCVVICPRKSTDGYFTALLRLNHTKAQEGSFMAMLKILHSSHWWVGLDYHVAVCLIEKEHHHQCHSERWFIKPSKKARFKGPFITSLYALFLSTCTLSGLICSFYSTASKVLGVDCRVERECCDLCFGGFIWDSGTRTVGLYYQR
ncbi:hypothetical protein F0562_033337 [Nyssa sinensis]|uniref:Uncharacterized protein n=1 Tax=Nyssa sinensis TaxID=561372 RepID=A0A5J5ARF2_9ASTE|nr:hypothetical protein F0562_033337 [Nyssa sinensis]